MDLLIQLLVGVGIIAAAWMLLAPRYEFVIRIENGQARVVSGKAPHGLVHDVAAVCRDAGVANASVWGSRRGRRIGLSFSGGVPEGCRQRLRNLMNLPR